MASYDLPTKAVIDGVDYAIRSDYRVALDVIEVMSDCELTDDERASLVLTCMYPDFDTMPTSYLQEAIDFAYWFISGGRESSRKRQPRLMDWGQDFTLIVSPVNRVLGYEVREVEYLHWWTFLSAYYEIGECLFAHVVSIRKKRGKGKKLDKSDEAFYRENQELIDIKAKLMEHEEELLSEWVR